MLTYRHHIDLLPRWLLALGLLVGAVLPVGAQESIAFLRSGAAANRGGERGAARSEVIASERFTLHRNLICFEATVDGRPGNYILDTGAPSLVINHRGAAPPQASYAGLGSGGEVPLTDYHVGTFTMAQRSVKNYWAIGLDLRSMEDRTSQRIDGFVGFDLINQGELRIDYARQYFSLRKSRRHPLHDGRSPRQVLRFELVGHLPVVNMEIGGKSYRFILDTGAGANLLDATTVETTATSITDRIMNIQGLDGQPADHPIVRLASYADAVELDFVHLPLDHLQSAGNLPIAGILGAPFLSNYTVGIDYRRRRVYLW